uniref:CCR4-NOT transcription complex subunit 11 n=1 Tax=Schistosoma mansoni TaxID=6183 RepID=A0A5K4EZJ1_SCHMA
MSISNKDVIALSNLLHPDRISRQTLQGISSAAQQQFAKADRYKLCRVLMFLLQNDFFHDAIIHFAAVYLLWDLWKSDNSSINNNPFTEFLVSFMQDEAHCKLPRSAISMFHTILRQPDQIHDFLKYTPAQIFDLPYSTDLRLDWDLVPVANSLKSSGRVPKFADSGMVCVVADEDIPRSFEPSFHLHNTNDCNGTSELQRQCLDSLLLRSELLIGRNNVFPEFLRIAPPLLPCPQGIDEILYNLDEGNESISRTVSNLSPSEKKSIKRSKPTYGWSEELIWLNPDIVEHDFHWNNSMELVDITVELRHLVSAAMTSTLTQSQQQTVVQAIKDNPDVIYNVGITPEIVPNFVNRNPVIAIEVLQLLITSPKRDEYLNALLKMEVTVQSIEVVNRLSTKIALPTEFIQDYISNCLAFCYSVNDKFYQMRHVRLVCVLLQSLIRNNILDIHNQDILIEVRTFCLEFTKAREATTLHRLILNMENTNTASSATTFSNNIGTSTTTTSSPTCSSTSTPQPEISNENKETS